MPNRSNIAYIYDGSLEGFLTCVHEAFYKREDPAFIIPHTETRQTLFDVKYIGTDNEKAVAVYRSISEKISKGAQDFIRLCALCTLPDKELLMLRFLREGYKIGSRIMMIPSKEPFCSLRAAVKSLTNEAHYLKGFIRFNAYRDTLAAEIEPKNDVLPIISPHFQARFRSENFIIYDRTHKKAFISSNGQRQTVDMESFTLPSDGDDREFSSLFKVFWNSVTIKERLNKKCQNTHLPKRYRKYMTEFLPDETTKNYLNSKN